MTTTTRGLRDYAKLILNREFRVRDTPEIQARIEKLAQGLFGNPKQKQGRSVFQIKTCAEKVVLEHALVELGFELNVTRDFDHLDRETWAWDARDPETGARFECKAFAEKWLNLQSEGVDTLATNVEEGLVDYIVSGKSELVGDEWFIEFYLIIKPKSGESLHEFFLDSFNEGKKYYRHDIAIGRGEAQISDKLKNWKKSA